MQLVAKAQRPLEFVTM